MTLFEQLRLIRQLSNEFFQECVRALGIDRFVEWLSQRLS